MNNTMELENNYTCFSFNQVNSCSSLSQNSNSSQNQEDFVLEYGDQSLLQMEIIDPINYNPDEDFLTISSMDHQNITQIANSSPISEEEEEENSNNFFKGIQAELMEEESLTDLLLAAAEAIEEQNQPLVSNLLEKLKNLLLCDVGSSSSSFNFNQLAWFFTQALHYKTLGNQIQITERNNNKSSMSAFQMLQQLSPYIKFAHFTANQAILEAAEGEKMIHVIDFDIMEGFQWPPLMADLAAKEEVCMLRLTAIVEQDNENEREEVEKTGRRLREFAKSINFPFIFDKTDDFGEIQEVGQSVIGNCSGILHHTNSSKIETFLNGVAKLSPKCVVLVEEEIFKVSKMGNSMSFVEFFFEAFHHFSALSDSILRCFSQENGFKFKEVVMTEFLGTRILEAISQFPCDYHKDEYLKGYKKIGFSSFNCSQAKYLISLFRGDFWVQNENCRLSLCWKSRPLCTATIWVPRLKSEQQI